MTTQPAFEHLANRRRLAFVLACSAITLFCIAALGLSLHSELIATWFYDLAWWSYIVFADALVYLRTGRSMLLTRPRAFASIALWSGAFWLFFEVVNFRIANWYYVGIPNDAWSRGPGMFFSFATVLPGIFETTDLLASFGLARGTRSCPWRVSPHARHVMFAAGLAFLVLPIVFPRQAYPLIWGATVLLAEPWLHARGARGLLTEVLAGDPRPALRTLAAGVVCGLLWEVWNHGASAHWIYTVPAFEHHKLFEMPFAGFLGFPPFALECYTFARLLVALEFVPEWECAAFELEPPLEVPRSAKRALRASLAVVLFSIPAIAGVNRFTVRATLPLVAEIPGITDAAAAALGRAGIDTVPQWLAAEHAGSSNGVLADLDPRHRERWLASARLMQVRGLGARGVRWLASAGVADVEELALADSQDLCERIARQGRGPSPDPTPAEVRVWVAGARAARDPTLRP